ncbi:MAG: hypothetical protein PWR24_321 [Desulfonauticus sp.]|nr:hypothetical protein [Desulfonauticus sp.]
MRKFIIFTLSIFLLSCSLGSKKDPYLIKPGIDLGYDYQAKFIKHFLKGEKCKAKYYFYKSNNIFARFDKLDEIGNNYFNLYKLEKYLGKEINYLYTKAVEFNPFIQNKSEKDALYSKLLHQKDTSSLLNLLKKEKNPLYRSVYARKAITVAENKKVKKNFLNLAFAVDKQYGWVLFLIEDWKLAKHILDTPEADLHIKVLTSALEHCEFDDNL